MLSGELILEALRIASLSDRFPLTPVPPSGRVESQYLFLVLPMGSHCNPVRHKRQSFSWQARSKSAMITQSRLHFLFNLTASWLDTLPISTCIHDSPRPPPLR